MKKWTIVFQLVTVLLIGAFCAGCSSDPLLTAVETATETWSESRGIPIETSEIEVLTQSESSAIVQVNPRYDYKNSSRHPFLRVEQIVLDCNLDEKWRCAVQPVVHDVVDKQYQSWLAENDINWLTEMGVDFNSDYRAEIETSDSESAIVRLSLSFNLYNNGVPETRHSRLYCTKNDTSWMCNNNFDVDFGAKHLLDLQNKSNLDIGLRLTRYDTTGSNGWTTVHMTMFLINNTDATLLASDWQNYGVVIENGYVRTITGEEFGIQKYHATSASDCGIEPLPISATRFDRNESNFFFPELPYGELKLCYEVPRDVANELTQLVLETKRGSEYVLSLQNPRILQELTNQQYSGLRESIKASTKSMDGFLEHLKVEIANNGDITYQMGSFLEWEFDHINVGLTFQNESSRNEFVGTYSVSIPEFVTLALGEQGEVSYRQIESTLYEPIYKASINRGRQIAVYSSLLLAPNHSNTRLIPLQEFPNVNLDETPDGYKPFDFILYIDEKTGEVSMYESVIDFY